MNKYAVSINPSHNKVYLANSKKMAIIELSLTMNNDGSLSDIGSIEIENIPYLTFTCNEALDDCKLDTLSKLSFTFAIFEIVEIEGSILLKPIRKNNFEFVSPAMSSMMKYTGKTNETFTRMMINLANSARTTTTERPKLLDPIAGKGTTLYESLILGYDAYGIEIGEKVANEAVVFVKKFLREAMYKHYVQSERVSGANKSFTSLRTSIDIGKDKEGMKNPHRFELIAGSATHVNAYFKKNTFDMIVGDLPYGVQHSNVTNQKQNSMTRSPKELLKACLTNWYNALKTGGSMALSWNTFVLDREDMENIISSYGFTVLSNGMYADCTHRVDQAIMRDVIIAVKE